ncbi:MAG: phenylalanine--tRNA ligase beta subunit-related protein [Elusimicrobiota bacterium]
MPALAIDPHPLLDLGAFLTTFPKPLGELPAPDWLSALLKHDAEAPLKREESVRTAVRDLLRHGGYKPTGRGKPSSEYLVGAATDGRLASINAAVDACNAASLHSGLPISVVDLDLAQPPWRAGLAPAGAKYVFNPAGQEIDLSGLLCLFDSQGPCANAVKDSQRTKTHERTTRTLSILWGTRSCPGRTERTVEWYRSLVDRLGAKTEELL